MRWPSPVADGVDRFDVGDVGRRELRLQIRRAGVIAAREHDAAARAKDVALAARRLRFDADHAPVLLDEPLGRRVRRGCRRRARGSGASGDRRTTSSSARRCACAGSGAAARAWARRTRRRGASATRACRSCCRRGCGAARGCRAARAAPACSARSSKCASGESWMPARFWCGVLVAVTEPTDHEVVPPVLRVLLEQDDAAPEARGFGRGREPRARRRRRR